MTKKIISEENWNIDYFNFLSVYCCPSVFSLFKIHKDLTYKQCFDMFLNMAGLPLSKKEAKWTMETSLYAHDLAVFRQNLCLLENIMKNSMVDLTNDNFKTALKYIREHITIEGGEELTNYNFIKLIRNSLAHNNELEEKPLLTFFEDPKEGYIKFKIEDPSRGIKLIIGPEDMEKLCFTLVHNAKSDYFSGSTLAVRTKRLKNALIGNYFDVKKINRYMQSVKSDETIEDIVLDENQETALTNYLNVGMAYNDDFCAVKLCGDKIISLPLTNTGLLNTVFPRKNNAVSLATHNTLSLYSIYGELKKNSNITSNQLLTKLYESTESSNADERDFGVMASYLLKSPYSVFLEISTALTTVLSNRDTEDLEEEYRAYFDEGTLHHVRNAMVHGTYFFDFKGNIQIYDGQRKLKHICTLDGSKVLSKTQEIVKERWRETFLTKRKDYIEKE